MMADINELGRYWIDNPPLHLVIGGLLTKNQGNEQPSSEDDIYRLLAQVAPHQSHNKVDATNPAGR